MGHGSPSIPHPRVDPLLHRGLFVSGATALPIRTEVALGARILGEDFRASGSMPPPVAAWLRVVRDAVETTSSQAPLMFYGSADRGRVVGQSTRDGGEPASDSLTSANLVSTILHAAFDVPQMRLQPALSSIARLGEPAPIPGVV